VVVVEPPLGVPWVPHRRWIVNPQSHQGISTTLETHERWSRIGGFLFFIFNLHFLFLVQFYFFLKKNFEGIK
jgi:hypothetical protein